MLPVVNLGTVITTDWYPSTLACKAGQSTSPGSQYCYQVSHIMGSGFRPMLWDWPFPLSLGTPAFDPGSGSGAGSGPGSGPNPHPSPWWH